MVAEGASAVHRTVELLQVLGSAEADHGSSCGVVEIAKKVGREKTQVSRALKALAETGLVERDEETLGYRLGWQFYALAVNAGDRRLRSMAMPVLRRLVATVKEQAHLSVLDNGSVLTVLSERPPQAVQVADWAGRTCALHNTSSGRALLFAWADEEIRELLSGTDFDSAGPSAPHTIDDLLRRLRDARDKGFAVADEEMDAGLIAVAAPVRDFRGEVVAALNVSAPKFRIGDDLARIRQAVVAASSHLSAGISAQGDAEGRRRSVSEVAAMR